MISQMPPFFTVEQAARALPWRLFGASLLAAPEPAEVSERILRQRGIVKEIPGLGDGDGDDGGWGCYGNFLGMYV